jgi:hypothetical protein
MSVHHDVTSPLPQAAFSDRLDLLEESGQVSPAARTAALGFVEEAERAFAVALDEANGAMLVTHLAMALTRAERGEEHPGDPPAAVVDEVRLHETEWRFVAERLAACADAIGAPLPDAEQAFVTAHLCAVTGA